MDRGAVSLRRQEILRAVDRNLEGLAITLQPWFNDQMSYSFLGLAQCGGGDSMKPSQQVNRSATTLACKCGVTEAHQHYILP